MLQSCLLLPTPLVSFRKAVPILRVDLQPKANVSGVVMIDHAAGLELAGIQVDGLAEGPVFDAENASQRGADGRRLAVPFDVKVVTGLLGVERKGIRVAARCVRSHGGGRLKPEQHAEQQKDER